MGTICAGYMLVEGRQTVFPAEIGYACDAPMEVVDVIRSHETTTPVQPRYVKSIFSR